MPKTKTIESFFEGQTKWKNEVNLLREIVLSTGLQEELKWGVACYTIDKKNVLIIHGFKEYVAINLFNGALLKDESKLLVQQTENVQAGRQIRFKNVEEIQVLTDTIKAYIFEAIECEKAGLKVKMKSVKAFERPVELDEIFSKDQALKEAWEGLTPGRQKGYLLHFSAPKQSATKISRIESSKGRIMIGKGLRDCICGLSKRMPNCDGSHKQLEK